MKNIPEGIVVLDLRQHAGSTMTVECSGDINSYVAVCNELERISTGENTSKDSYAGDIHAHSIFTGVFPTQVSMGQVSAHNPKEVKFSVLLSFDTFTTKVTAASGAPRVTPEMLTAARVTLSDDCYKMSDRDLENIWRAMYMAIK